MAKGGNDGIKKLELKTARNLVGAATTAVAIIRYIIITPYRRQFCCI